MARVWVQVLLSNERGDNRWGDYDQIDPTLAAAWIAEHPSTRRIKPCVHNVPPPSAHSDGRKYGKCGACGLWVESFLIDGDEDRRETWSGWRVVGTGVLTSPEDAERILNG